MEDKENNINMKQNMNNVMIENATKVVVQAYEDIAHPILQSVGNVVSLPFKAVDAALTPIKRWIDKKNFNYEETKKLLAKKLENIEETKIVEPEPYVAVPALQQLSYSYDSVDLRNMYANLLATSMTKDTDLSVHPSYVDIIKQLSPIDAKALTRIFSPQYLSVVTVRAHFTNDDTYKEIYNNYSIELADLYPNTLELSASLLNLERLGIIQIDFDRLVRPESKYDIYNECNMLINAHAKYKDRKDVSIEMKKGLINLTDFGLSFCMTCCDRPPLD